MPRQKKTIWVQGEAEGEESEQELKHQFTFCAMALKHKNTADFCRFVAQLSEQFRLLM